MHRRGAFTAAQTAFNNTEKNRACRLADPVFLFGIGVRAGGIQTLSLILMIIWV